ncbi:MAG: diaminopimelate decarboxylase [Candidatus Azobacteroides sp.]|nr:diaminopimelate decarboxylase [Candidatus Azobacteroides sp.]
MKGCFPIHKFRELTTPFYFYNTTLLHETLQTVKHEIEKYPGFCMHYAVKANANPKILSMIAAYDFGADCVSGGEIKAALSAGFPAEKIVFAGVGKADWEINLALDAEIFCFNVESAAELKVIQELAAAKGKTASVALRINPEVKVNTHHYITTGLKENKFGINLDKLDGVLDMLPNLPNIKLIGIHFHIGSQITDPESFVGLCIRANEIQKNLLARKIFIEHLNMGGGLGIDYSHPNKQPIPDFKNYFEIFDKHLHTNADQPVHFELGRAIVAQCGSLITKVLYVKEGSCKNFVIVDAGMTDLIRPALYNAYHKIENITSDLPVEKYDVVGPICESSDCFGKETDLNQTQRGDLIALRSAGAYGEIMASRYNCRRLPKSYYSDELI